MNKQQIKLEIQRIIEAENSPITADQIYAKLTARVDPGRTQETIRKYIREMVNDGTALIGSSNRGYFSIQSKEQVQQALSYVNNRIPKLQNRAQNIKDSWNERNPNDQI